MKQISLKLLIFTMLLALFSCFKKRQEDSQVTVANLTPDQALADFDEIASKIRGLYGPYQYKEQRFGINIEQLIQEARKNVQEATTDDMVYAAYTRLLSKFHDGHISLIFPRSASRMKSYSVQLLTAPFDDKFAIVALGRPLTVTGIERGDELLKIDGETPDALLKKIAPFTTWANDLSQKHDAFIFFSRDSYMTDIIPTQKNVTITVRKPSGKELTVSIPWEVTAFTPPNETIEPASGSMKGLQAIAPFASRYNQSLKGTVLEMAAPKPYFVSARVTFKFGLNPAPIDKDHQIKYKLTAESHPEIFANLYTYNGKKILLIRQPSYVGTGPDDVELKLQFYRAILDQYEDQIDALVIDQNHNPGGYLQYATDFFRMFITNEKEKNLVQAINTDRTWISSLRNEAKQLSAMNLDEMAQMNLYNASLVEDANEKGLRLSPALPLIGENYLSPSEQYTFKKPVLLLTDELSGSSADIFPMLMKSAKRAFIFGQKTMGLGGNVEKVATLTYSGASLSLTRGIFSVYDEKGNYPAQSWVENNGITPDRKYSTTLEDFRTDYVPYFTAMNDYLISTLSQ